MGRGRPKLNKRQVALRLSVDLIDYLKVLARLEAVSYLRLVERAIGQTYPHIKHKLEQGGK